MLLVTAGWSPVDRDYYTSLLERQYRPNLDGEDEAIYLNAKDKYITRSQRMFDNHTGYSRTDYVFTMVPRQQCCSDAILMCSCAALLLFC